MPIKLLIIDMRHVPYIDQSGLYSLESIILSLEQNKVQVYLLNLQKTTSCDDEKYITHPQCSRIQFLI
ncbi:MAG: sodium-independent anion transporter [Saprospiraceae bacterium]|nr:sodium-independent anion transporter [Saprospiraceae bacterium]